MSSTPSDRITWQRLNCLVNQGLGHFSGRIKALLTNYLLPATCILCGLSTYRSLDLCRTCQQDLPWLKYACIGCARALSQSRGHSVLCANCLRKMPAFDKVIALFTYTKPIDRLIMDLKFKGRLLYARVLGELLTEKLAQVYQSDSLPELIIPVALHPNRLKERGFNQAIELARPISKQLNIAIAPNMCQRIRSTAPQVSLPANQRAKNVKNAFILHKPLTAKHVSILDDVMTTGHTVTELSRILRKAGVKRIDIWCCARTL